MLGWRMKMRTISQTMRRNLKKMQASMGVVRRVSPAMMTTWMKTKMKIKALIIRKIRKLVSCRYLAKFMIFKIFLFELPGFIFVFKNELL